MRIQCLGLRKGRDSRIFMFTFPLLLALGCTSTSLEGVVEDPEGVPIADVKVTASVSDCSTVTDSSGRFSLECMAGPWAVTFSLEGYLGEERDFDVHDGTQNSLPKVFLTKIPSGDGIHILTEGVFAPLSASEVVRATVSNGKAKKRSFCVNRDLTPPLVTTGEQVTLLAQNVPGWRAFQMDAEGCAYRDSRNSDGHWVVDHQVHPSIQAETIHPGTIIHRWTAQPGDYFLADWAGFFVPTEPKGDAYSGHWVQISD